MKARPRLRVVYEIRDPRDPLPFYVGATGRLDGRAGEHLRGGVASTRRRIAEIKAAGLQPLFTVVCTCASASERRARELQTIAHRLAEGATLTNPHKDYRLSALRFPQEPIHDTDSNQKDRQQ